MKRQWIATGLALVAATVIGCAGAPSGPGAGSVAPHANGSERGSGSPGQGTGDPGATRDGSAGGQEPAPGQSISPTGTADPPASSNGRDPAPPKSPQPAKPADAPSVPGGAGKDSIGFSLLSSNGGVVNFKDLRGTVPFGIFFYGGAGCADCRDRLQAMQDAYSRFKQVGAELIAISTDLPEKTRMTVESIGIEFPVLSDVDGSVSERWGVFNLLDNGHAAPAMFVFDSSGDEIGRQIGFSASDLPGLDETLQSIQRSFDAGVAEPTPTPLMGPPTTAPPATPTQQAAVPISANPTPAPFSPGPGVTDFRLPDAIGGGEVSLSESLRNGNVVLVFYRAFW